jgi:hypothetical protein
LVKIAVPLKISKHWNIDRGKIFRSTYKYNGTSRIFKFSFKPLTGELLFDVAPTHHDTMVLNYGKGKFNDYIRGICFWTKRVIYLRGHANENWLKATKAMLGKNGVPANYRVVWGVDAATELETELRGL